MGMSNALATACILEAFSREIAQNGGPVKDACNDGQSLRPFGPAANRSLAFKFEFGSPLAMLPLMKAYLVTTGTLWTLFAMMHVAKSIAERAQFATHPLEYLGMSALGLVAAVLSVWAWCLLRLRLRK